MLVVFMNDYDMNENVIVFERNESVLIVLLDEV